MLCYSLASRVMSFSLLFCYTSLCHCHYYFICSTKDKAGDNAASLYEIVYASSCMTTEREPKGKPDEQVKNLLTNAAYVIVHFLTEQNLSNTRTTCKGISNRFEHYSMALWLICWCSYNTNYNRSDMMRKQEKIRSVIRKILCQFGLEPKPRREAQDNKTINLATVQFVYFKYIFNCSTDFLTWSCKCQGFPNVEAIHITSNFWLLVGCND